MPQKDEISLKIPEGDVAKIRSAIAVLKSSLMPYLSNLSGQDKLELPKMGDKTFTFVQKAYEYAQSHKELAPAFLDLEAMAIDMAAVTLLREFSQSIMPLSVALEDSLILSGSEAYQAALMMYGSVKSAAKAKVPDSIAIRDDLAARFPGGWTKKKSKAS
jgi:hypothetical protein